MTQGNPNSLMLLNLNAKITKLLTSSNLEKVDENVQEENNDFLNELKDILSNYDSGSEKAFSSRSGSVERDKDNIGNEVNINNHKNDNINKNNKYKKDNKLKSQNSKS